MSALSSTGCGDPCLDDGRGKGNAVCDTNASNDETATAGTAETSDTNDDNESGSESASETATETDTDTDTATETATETEGPDETWCVDEDGDGFGDPDNCFPVPAGEDPPAGAVPEDQATDCDDADPNTFPGAAEIEDPIACMTDADDDGWGDDMPSSPNAVPGTDCDDANANAFPGAAENEEPPDACMEDDDMDGWGDTDPSGINTLPGTDCADDDAMVMMCELWCEDMDMDSFGNPDVCVFVPPGDPPPPGYVMDNTDCLDTDANVFVGAAELDDPNACMSDADGDGWGDPMPMAMGVVPGRDCDDADPNAVVCVDASPGCVDTTFGMAVGLMSQATGGDGNYTYLWDPPETLDDETLQNPIASPTSITTYTVTATDGLNNMGSDEVTIHLSDLPWVLDGNNADCMAVGFVGPASAHSVSQDGTEICTTSNSDPTAYVCPIVHQEAHITGSMTVTDDVGDNDLMGFVWGWQNSNQFYLFQWKRQTQNWYNCTGNEGMSVKKVDAQGPYVIQDFACSMDTNNTTVLLSEMDIGAAGWTEGFVYDVDILYDLTQTEITIVDTTNMVQVANFIVMDNSYPSGQFGTYDFSQQNACSGPWMSTCL